MATSSDDNTTTTTTSSFAKYPYPTEFNVLDFVSQKELSDRNYKNWRKLMRDFIESQGLIGFIDGTVKEPPRVDVAGAATNQEYYMSWKKSNNLVRGWMLATLTEDHRLQVLNLKTAQKLWTRLEAMFDPTVNTLESDPEKEKRLARYVPLYQAAIKGDWDNAIPIIEEEPYAVRARITTPFDETVLMLAIASVHRNHFVRKLLEKMSLEDVALVDCYGWTALHVAARNGNIEGAKMLVNKNSDLPNVFDNKGATPLYYAAERGKREMVVYLWKNTKNDVLFKDVAGVKFLRNLIKSEFYDMAVTLLQQKPELACMKPSLFEIITEKHYSFPSRNPLNFWHRILSMVPMESDSIANRHNNGDIEDPTNGCNTSVRQRLHFIFWKVAEKIVPKIKQLRETKLTHYYVLELLKSLCKEVAKAESLSTVERIFKPALCKAAYVGIPEIVEEIIVSYPSALYFRTMNGLNIFQSAIVWQSEHVFNLLYQLNDAVEYIGRRDESGNNCLHLVTRLGHQQQISLRANTVGPILQMQRELQWFKVVKEFSTPRQNEKRNKDGMTPTEVFTETHQELRKEAEQWMKDTATSCTIVAALITTMVFATSITVPGGNNNNDGQPLFSKHKAFAIFGVSNAVALFSSITSVLMFLLILNSRYSEEDFYRTLPERLIIGLVTLFVSILSTMVASGSILYLVFGNNKAWVLIPVVALAGIPTTLFGAFQFPLLWERIHSTYGRGIFGKQSDRALD